MYWRQFEGDLKIRDQDSGHVEDESWVYVIDCLVRMKLDLNLIHVNLKKKGLKGIYYGGDYHTDALVEGKIVCLLFSLLFVCHCL